MQAEQKIQVFIVDDHVLIREGLKRILKSEPDIDVIGETDNPHTVPGFIKKNDIDIVILDLSMPGKNGFDVIREIKSIKPMLPVLVLSMHPEEPYAKRALKAGASGYITKESAAEELLSAVRKIFSGKKYISTNLAEHIADTSADDIKDLHELLSDREFQVLQMMGGGKTQSEIANELCLSISTVNTYRSRILEKLNLHSNVELIHYAIKNGLFT